MSDVSTPSENSCPECRGTGRDPMSDNVNWLPCMSCNGTGLHRDARLHYSTSAEKS